MKMNILVIGRHAQIMETVLRLINNQSEWQATGALTDDEALKKFDKQNFEIVLVGGGVEEQSERELTRAFKKKILALKSFVIMAVEVGCFSMKFRRH